MASSKSRRAIAAQVARILREERLKRNFSMNSLAAKAGLSQQMVSYVEREMRSPTLDTLLRIAEALELNLAGVFQRASRDAALPTRKAGKESKAPH